MIELRLLHAFVTLAHERHYGRAAAALHVEPSPFGRQIRRLEKLVGAPLIDREARGEIRLTRAGSLLEHRARGLLADADELLISTRRTAAGEEGTLRVGYLNEVTAELLPLALKTYTAARPRVRLQLIEDRTRPQLEALLEGRLDAAFVRSPDVPEELRYEPLTEEALVLAQPSAVEHPRGDRVEWGALSQQERKRRPLGEYRDRGFLFLGASGSPGLRRDIFAACSAAGFEPAIVREVSPLTALLLHVAAGEGVALVPASIVHQYPVPGVRYVHLAEPVPTSTLGIAWRNRPDAITTEFLEATRQVAAESRHLRA